MPERHVKNEIILELSLTHERSTEATDEPETHKQRLTVKKNKAKQMQTTTDSSSKGGLSKCNITPKTHELQT